MAGAASAEEVPRSRAPIASSFAPAQRQAAPAVVDSYARKGRAADPFLSDPFFRFFFFEGFGGGDGLQRPWLGARMPAGRRRERGSRGAA